MLAHRPMASGRGDGLFFALPTMATADAMYRRLGDAYDRLFAHNTRPSLVLAHSRRSLHSGFTASILDGAADRQEDAAEASNQTAEVQGAAWIADDRRKAFLAEIGVGAIDQAIMAVLPTRHAPLRLLGLSRRVLVVDEAHAYDAYMTEELRRLLAFQAALGGSAIVLSATLTTRQRAEINSAFLSGLGRTAEPDGATAYPLVTVASAIGVTAAPCALAPGLARRITVQRVADKLNAVAEITAAARAGAAVAWVRNAVDDAIEGHAALRSAGLAPILFHARFAVGDRQEIERKVVDCFSRDSLTEQRSGNVLVATQVVEQSLDLDFDLMVTDLAPADLVIQRLTARGIAWQNLLEIDKPYRRDAGLWEPDTRTPTRLGEPQRTFRLARIEGGCVVSWYGDDDLDRAWALSEVAVRATRLARAVEDATVKAAKRDWSSWDQDIPVLLLQPDGVGRWAGIGVDPMPPKV